MIIFFTPLQGKALIRPIAFRPTPGPNSGASTPTNGPLLGFRPPSNGPDSLHGLARASPATSQGGPFTPATNTNDGFAPGHPLVKDGRRHYGSKNYFFTILQYSFTRFLTAYYVCGIGYAMLLKKEQFFLSVVRAGNFKTCLTSGKLII